MREKVGGARKESTNVVDVGRLGLPGGRGDGFLVGRGLLREGRGETSSLDRDKGICEV